MLFKCWLWQKQLGVYARIVSNKIRTINLRFFFFLNSIFCHFYEFIYACIFVCWFWCILLFVILSTLYIFTVISDIQLFTCFLEKIVGFSIPFKIKEKYNPLFFQYLFWLPVGCHKHLFLMKKMNTINVYLSRKLKK